MSRTRIVLHIDRLVLRGVKPQQRQALADALRSALTTQLTDPDSAARLAGVGHLESLRVPAAPATGERGPEALGRASGERIARSLQS